ncbi:MAG: type VI secretion system tube protein Hcp [Gemmatimonadota bacterium]
MAFDAFLKIEGIDGESTRKGFEKQIELISFSWGASNPTTIGSSGPGGGAGKASVSSFNCLKITDAASPPLFQACCSGKHFPKAKVTLRKAGGESPVDYLMYEFENVYIESVQWSGASGGDDRPTESLSLAFGRVTVTYTPQADQGATGSPVVGSWSVQTASV